jgi:NADPH2:quinone reductase
MRAVGFTRKALPIEDPESLIDLELPPPATPDGRDLLVRVHAVSVNPRDMKTRMTQDADASNPVVLGYDASGVVEAAGPHCSLFRAGDAVMYAGVLDRPGSNAELQLVDERIVGRKPASIDHAAAASIPLTALTAYEMLFDRLCIVQGDAGSDGVLLIVGGAGGVGSWAIQLARALTEATVVATASRPASADWVRRCGAHHVIDHTRPMPPQLEDLDLTPCRWIFSTHTSERSWAEMAEIVAPQGRIGLIDDPEPLDLRLIKFKSASIHWEAMFTRPMFDTPDMDRQHEILDDVSALVDTGRLRATATESFGTINAANLRRAHAAIESGQVIGKIVLSGF